MGEDIINKVAEAGIEQIDLKMFMPDKKQIILLDIKDQLWNNLVIKEKEFRAWIKNHNWMQYEGKTVAVFCSADAIIPAWVYMLITSELKNSTVIYGDLEAATESLFFNSLSSYDSSKLQDKIVMVKGCSDIPCPEKAYVVLTKKLLPFVKSLMFGEPCSAVPVYKRK
ncbi:MAG: DUF2480 family protein [Crocinitomicaceae bacterium]|nr:DUF2480 family protein [Crocinitomicaceae bacterium]MBK8927183.1 DUF2480 family protein [Crocinitomicaceae bacterium]